MSDLESIPAIIDQLCEMFDESVAALRGALARYPLRGERPDAEARARGLFAYPELRIDYSFDQPPAFPPRAFGRLNQPGRYAISIARPRHFRKYLAEQLEYLVRDYNVEISVGPSAERSPILSSTAPKTSGRRRPRGRFSRWVPATEPPISATRSPKELGLQRKPTALALFDGPRVDLSLARLRH